MKHLISFSEIILRYIEYRIKAKNQYHIHSPFVFELVTQVILRKEKTKNYSDINILRKSLNKSKKIITINDLGAGSNINSKNKKTIKTILKNASTSKKFGELLSRIVKFYNSTHIIEMGTSLGISTCYLSKGNPLSRVYTLEGCQNTGKIASENFKKLSLENINIVIGDFKDTLRKTLNNITPIDLAFIDGDHQEESTISYFETCLEFSHHNTIFIFDDIHWSKGMEHAWNYIKNHNKTKVTIDLFQIGIVFIKPDLSKEHFTIRF